jgi:CRISPR-associated protein Cmr2
MAALPFLCALNTLKDDKRQEAEKWKTEYLNKLEDLQDRVPFALDILPKRYREHNYWDKIFSLGSYDGALLFPERFPDIVGDTENFQEAKKAFQQASAILEAFCRKVGLYPNPYYVLLAADGDFMGRVIDAQAKVSAGMKRHQQLSQALATFSTGVRKIVKAHAGVRIYSGGDDVLALLPLHEAVQCARVLAESFRTLLRPFQSEQGSSPTLSVGLAVVHHLHPLGDALEIARQAEGRAKKYPGKNALAITVHKRGGPPCEIGGHWDVFEARLEAQIGLYQQDIIPTGMAYELDEIAQRLEPDPEQAGNSSVSPPYVQYAALRVFQRKLDEAKRAGHSEKEVEATLKLLKEMIGLEQLQPVRVGTLADELVVARLFADARRLARGQGKGELA